MNAKNKISNQNKGNGPKFKSFKETFPICAFALAVGLIYPNKTNIRARALIFTFIVAYNGIIIIWWLLYIYKCIITSDKFNLARNITVGVPISLFFFKFFYITYKNDSFGELLEKISEDLIRGNDMDEDYQKIYERHIKLGKLGQNCWVIIPVVLSSQFPMFAGACMIYENLKSDMGKRYMVHEMELKYIEDKQYETPYFEMLFACILLQCVILVPNFTGFDGSFCIATAHLQLKLKLMTNKLHRAFKDSKNNLQLEEKVKEVIRDHQEAFRFYNNLENMYGGWLLVVFLITSVVISLNLYQNSISEVIDPKYTLFVVSGVVHMYTPCYFASNLSKSGEDLCSDIYSVPWEECANPVVTKLLIFMIAKSQQPLHLTGKGMVYFNMQLFISVLQTSYSFYTLISS
nr:odorant receptor 21 [Papilio machaon]